MKLFGCILSMALWLLLAACSNERDIKITVPQYYGNPNVLLVRCKIELKHYFWSGFHGGHVVYSVTGIEKTTMDNAVLIAANFKSKSYGYFFYSSDETDFCEIYCLDYNETTSPLFIPSIMNKAEPNWLNGSVPSRKYSEDVAVNKILISILSHAQTDEDRQSRTLAIENYTKTSN